MQQRRRLIEDVEKNGVSIVQTAKNLSIKLSTAKLILRRFRESGTFFNKKTKSGTEVQQQSDAGEDEQYFPFQNC